MPLSTMITPSRPAAKRIAQDGTDKSGSLAFRSCYGLKRVTFENPEGWYWTCVYNDTDYDLDLSNPEKNAEMLSTMDFDDGCGGWFRK